MLEEVLSSHVLRYDDEGVYVGACLVSNHVEVKLKSQSTDQARKPQGDNSQM